MNWWFVLPAIIAAFVLFEIGYWIGKDKGSDQAWKWRRKFEEEHRRYVLLEQKANGLEHELEFFYPKTVWRNERWIPPDQPYGSP